MEERIIDDEYGRGIRLKKTKEGYVDVTDELAKETQEGEYAADEAGEEVAFEFPVLDTDEDDEDLVGLSPEEAAKLRRQKEEEAKRRQEEYEQTCKEGDELLASGSFKAAELKFEKALNLDDEATAASVGYWRAKTEDFQNPDALIGEYADASIESLEYDLGINAVDIIKRDYQPVFQKRVRELSVEEETLSAQVEEKKTARRVLLSERVKRSTLVFVGVTLLMAAALALTVLFGTKNMATREDTYFIPMIVCAVAAFALFLAFVVVTNKWVNALRMRRANERLSATEDGRNLIRVRDYKELYECLLLSEEEN